MAILYFTDLDVWQKSMDLSVEIFKTVKFLPKEELYGLSDQMRRAVISIPSNIAEGHQRGSTKDYIRFLYISKGSLGELITQIMLCERLGYIEEQKSHELINKCVEIQRMVSGLVNSLLLRLQKETQREKTDS